MPEALWIPRRLVKMHSGRMWTLHELADAAELTPTDAKIAAERLVLHGELIRSSVEHYTRPSTEDE